MWKRKRKCKRTDLEMIKTEKYKKEREKGREEYKLKNIGNIDRIK